MEIYDLSENQMQARLDEQELALLIASACGVAARDVGVSIDSMQEVAIGYIDGSGETLLRIQRLLHQLKKEPNPASQRGSDPDRAIIEALDSAADPMTAASLRKIVGGTAAQLRTSLDRLIETGQIAFSGKGTGTRYSPMNRRTLSSSELDDFVDGYLEAMLWSSLDDNDEPLDTNYGLNTIATESKKSAVADAKKFLLTSILYESEPMVVADLIAAKARTFSLGNWTIFEQAGHDFWFTRNHHGVGFWDGDWDNDSSDTAGDILSNVSHQFGEVDGSVHRGRVYIE